MKYKSIFAFLAVLLIAVSVASVYAESVNLGPFNFDVPDDFKVTKTNDTSIVLEHDHEQIIVTTEIVGQDAVNSYLEGQGFFTGQSTHGTMRVDGTGPTGTYEYDSTTYSKNHGYAVAYFLNRDGNTVTVIGIDNDFDNDGGDSEPDDLTSAVGDVVKYIMLKK